MTEKQLWDRLRDSLGWRWRAQRHEDRYSIGIPDLSYSCGGVRGWIELKCLPCLPPIVRLPKWTPHQRNWLRDDYRQAGPGGWLLVAFGESGAALYSQPSADKLELSSANEAIGLAHMTWGWRDRDWDVQFLACMANPHRLTPAAGNGLPAECLHPKLQGLKLRRV